MSDVAARMERVIGDVVRHALEQTAASGIVVLDDDTAEGGLLCSWLKRMSAGPRIWRGGAVASNVHGTEAPADALLAHPVNRTSLLLGGRPPHADLLPFGDVPATVMQQLAGGWSGPADVEALASRIGVELMDAALTRLVDDRETASDAISGLDAAAGAELLRLYERGRFFRRHPRLVPKLGARTLGIDLMD